MQSLGVHFLHEYNVYILILHVNYLEKLNFIHHLFKV